MIDELIDQEHYLYHWIDSNNNKLSYREYHISEENICSTTKLEDLEPSEEDFEGYMGNWGNTMEYWYRRAAIVLWPKEYQISMDFDLDYSNQLKKLVALTNKPGNEKQVKEIVHTAKEYLCENSSKNDIDKILQIAYYINDKSMAKQLLGNFNLKIILKKHVSFITKLHERYGADNVMNLRN